MGCRDGATEETSVVAEKTGYLYRVRDLFSAVGGGLGGNVEFRVGATEETSVVAEKTGYLYRVRELFSAVVVD